jgi:hypothetical protein
MMKPIERLMLHDFIIIAATLAIPAVLFVMFWRGSGQ